MIKIGYKEEITLYLKLTFSSLPQFFEVIELDINTYLLN